MDFHEVRLAEADCPPVPLPVPEAQRLALDLYGLSGRFTPLTSERDVLYHIEDQSGDHYLLRVSGAAEPREVLRFQNDALIHIEAIDPELSVPRVCRSRHGNDIEVTSAGGSEHSVRVLTYLPGVPLRGQPTTPELRRDVGRSLARLDRALQDLPAPKIGNRLIWDIRKVGILHALISYVEGERARAAANSVLAILSEEILGRIDAFGSQVIHNDFNRKNVLLRPAAPDRVSGIIDFGDMIVAPRVIDLGVAVARHIDVGHAIQEACEILAGYNSILPLREEEIDTLYWLICARLALRAAVWSWRCSRDDPRCDRTQIVTSLQLLDELQAHGAGATSQTFRAACLS